VIRPGGIGDFIVSLPALEFLEPSEVWVARPNVPLVRFADRARAIGDTGLDLLEPPPSLLERLSEFDEIHSWHGAARDDFRAAVARFPFRFYRALPDGAMHAVDFYLRQVGAPAGAAPRIACQAEPHGHVIIHPFSGSPRKNWPLDRFRALAQRISAIAPVEWIAGPEEFLEGARRFDDLYELAAHLAGARLYIGNDSGITHLAAAAGAPVISLFGTTDPAVWGPRGDRVHIIHSLDTSVEDVYAMVNFS
jgi:hypothetical protein